MIPARNRAATASGLAAARVSLVSCQIAAAAMSLCVMCSMCAQQFFVLSAFFLRCYDPREGSRRFTSTRIGTVTRCVVTASIAGNRYKPRTDGCQTLKIIDPQDANRLITPNRFLPMSSPNIRTTHSSAQRVAPRPGSPTTPVPASSRRLRVRRRAKLVKQVCGLLRLEGRAAPRCAPPGCHWRSWGRSERAGGR